MWRNKTYGELMVVIPVVTSGSAGTLDTIFEIKIVMTVKIFWLKLHNSCWTVWFLIDTNQISTRGCKTVFPFSLNFFNQHHQNFWFKKFACRTSLKSNFTFVHRIWWFVMTKNDHPSEKSSSIPFAVKKNRALKMILSLPIALLPTVAFSLI